MNSGYGKIARILTLVFAAGAGTASAESMYQGGYVEGNLGYAFGPSVDTETFSGTVDGITAKDVGFSLDFEDDVSFGFEAGLNLRGPVRIGLGVTRFNFDLDKLSGKGTLSDGTDTVDLGGESVGSDVLNSVGIDADNNATLYSFNAYYDFAEIAGFQPFLGAGVGFTDIDNAKDNELTGSLYAGVKYAFEGGMYLGGRFAYHAVDSSEDELGIEYDSFGVSNVSVLLGFDF